MRRLHLILGTTAAIVALVGLPVVALAGIASTAHNLSGETGTNGEICIVCHTPHNGDTSLLSAPLWDHEVTAVTDYSMYDSDTMTADMTGAQPGETSLLCLSCHDGTVAIDSFGANTGTNFMATDAAGYVGQDLSDDHPIGFTYGTALSTADPGLYDPTATDAGLTLKPGNINVAMLFGAGDDQLECASCHDAHDAAGVGSFLRKDNTNSDLCLTCHNK
jgi:predicted CXXCH cytochrome family protein